MGRTHRPRDAHAVQRHLERYGMEPHAGQISLLNRKIREAQRYGSDEARFIRKRSNRVSVWEVDGKRVLYCKKRKTIVTFLPPVEGKHAEKEAD